LIKIELTDVDCIPGISDNLLSRGSADAKGLSFISERGKLRILSGDKTIIEGKKCQGNIYWLSLQDPAKAKFAKVERSLEEWHEVLGLPAIDRIKQLGKTEISNGLKLVEHACEDDRCADCCSGKTCHSSHPSSSRSRSIQPLERVHAYLVGPMRPSSLANKETHLMVTFSQPSPCAILLLRAVLFKKILFIRPTSAVFLQFFCRKVYFFGVRRSSRTTV